MNITIVIAPTSGCVETTVCNVVEKLVEERPEEASREILKACGVV
jgi:hypothetical protein